MHYIVRFLNPCRKRGNPISHGNKRCWSDARTWSKHSASRHPSLLDVRIQSLVETHGSPIHSEVSSFLTAPYNSSRAWHRRQSQEGICDSTKKIPRVLRPFLGSMAYPKSWRFRPTIRHAHVQVASRQCHSNERQSPANRLGGTQSIVALGSTRDYSIPWRVSQAHQVSSRPQVHSSTQSSMVPFWKAQSKVVNRPVNATHMASEHLPRLQMLRLLTWI